MKLRISRRAFAAGAAALPLTPAIAGEATAKTEHGLLVFSANERKTMAALAEIFIPRTDTGGATDAQVTEHLDALLHADPLAERQHFLEGLWAYQAFLRDHGQAEQSKLVSQALEDKTHPQHAFLRQAKAYTARIYYSTEIGQNELNKGSRVPQAYF